MFAVTPVVVFCAASLGGSETEIPGAVAFFSCLLRVGRSNAPSTRWWVCAAVSGAVLALSRSTGSAWAAGASGPGLP